MADQSAFVEHAARLQLDEKRSFSQLVLVKVFFPQKQIVNASHQPTATDRVVICGPIHQKIPVA